MFESSENTPSFQALSRDLISVAFPYREGLQWVTVQKKTEKIIATGIVSTSVILAVGVPSQENHEFKVSLGYISNSKPAKTMRLY